MNDIPSYPWDEGDTVYATALNAAIALGQSNQWHTGSGVPNDALGKDGDLYLDTATGNVYQRSAGHYTLTGTIAGPPGPPGPSTPGPPGPPGPATGVQSITTTGAGISGGPITVSGALQVQWNAGLVNSIGTGLSAAGGTLVVTAAPGGGGASITVSDTPPTLTNGALWFDSVGTQMFVGYNDGTSLQWVPVVNQSIGSGTTGVVSFNTRSGAVTLLAADVTTVLPPSSTTPVMNGAAAVGTGTTWARADHVHPTDTTLAATLSPVFTGDPQAPTAAAGDSDTSIATTAFVQAAQRYLNYVDNSGFSVNQRAFVSGTALAAGIYGHDRWKAGAGGCTYTFAAPVGPANTITITAGTLQQVIEGASLAGGNYRLSWAGTAQGRVGAGSYAASPVVVSGIVAGANTTIEFNTGTLGTVKFEAGTVPTPWVAQPARYDLANCQRFYQVGRWGMVGNSVAGGTNITTLSLPVPMRAAPTLGYDLSGGTVNFASGSPGVASSFGNAYLVQTIVATAAGAYQAIGGFTASADL